MLITCIDREYCKKLIVMFPGQSHPSHMHREKEETFQVLSGRFNVLVDGSLHKLSPGESLTIHPGQWHGFASERGCIVEEVSTRYKPNGSEYHPEDIKCPDRKTLIHLV